MIYFSLAYRSWLPDRSGIPFGHVVVAELGVVERRAQHPLIVGLWDLVIPPGRNDVARVELP